MTCFWKGIIDGLYHTNNITSNILTTRPTPNNFVSFLKDKNKLENNVLVQDIKLTRKELEENFTHIKDFNNESINHGYDCSTSDPFLILICDLFSINILHDYCGYKILYKNNDSKYTIHLSSNRGHLHFVRLVENHTNNII